MLPGIELFTAGFTSRVFVFIGRGKALNNFAIGYTNYPRCNIRMKSDLRTIFIPGLCRLIFVRTLALFSAMLNVYSYS